MSTPETVKIKYTGKEPIKSLIDNGGSVEWKTGDVKDVVKSKARNHTKYPYFEEVSEKFVITEKTLKKVVKQSNEDQKKVVEKAKKKAKK